MNKIRIMQTYSLAADIVDAERMLARDRREFPHVARRYGRVFARARFDQSLAWLSHLRTTAHASAGVEASGPHVVVSVFDGGECIWRDIPLGHSPIRLPRSNYWREQISKATA